jgi:hypothetical protein
VRAEVPVDLDEGEAKRLILDELAKAEYQQSQPNWLDTIAQGFLDWLSSLQFDGDEGPPEALLAIIVVAVIGAIVIAVLVFGLPRLNRRSAASSVVFGEHDERSAEAMRHAAERSAADGDFTLAVAEMFRSIARGLTERTIVTVMPGTTAGDFSRRASSAFPAETESIAEAASAFDGVRYLGQPGSSAQFAAVNALESRLRASRPISSSEGASTPSSGAGR